SVRVHVADLRTAQGRSTPDVCRVHARTGRCGHAADGRRERLRPVAHGRAPDGVRGAQQGMGERAGRTGQLPRCRLISRPSPNRSSPLWPTRPDARSWLHWPLAARRRPPTWPIGWRSPRGATPTAVADRLPVTRQAIAKHLTLMAEAGLVTAEHGERRRVRYRLRSAPMQVAQQFLAALARDWDGRLDALKDVLSKD